MHNYIQKFFVLFFAFLLMHSFSCAEELEFAQVADVHYSIDDINLDRYLYFLSLSVKKNDPDFVIFLGDNVDKSREDDVIGFMRAIHSIKTPYYIVLGKNDAHRLNGLEKEIYLDIVSAFNRNQPDNKKYYYFKPKKDIVCVVLDDTSDFAPSKHGEISEEQLIWLENLLLKYPKKLFLIFHHSPLIPPRNEYKLSMVNTEKYKDLLSKYTNILTVSSGHYHQSSIQTDDNGIRHISVPSFGDIPHSYQLIKVIYDENSYSSPKDVKIEITQIKV